MALLRRVWPVWVVLVCSATFISIRLARYGGDAYLLAEPGTRFASGVAGGTEGYDGQFALYIATDPQPDSVRSQLDVPAYRYQRILLPLLARLSVLGRAALVPWALIVWNLAFHSMGTLCVVLILERYSQWIGHGLLYGLFVGLLAGVGADLLEPAAYALVALAFLLRIDGRKTVSVLLVGLSVLAKETTLPFLVALFAADMLDRRDDNPWLAYLLVAVVLAGWQLWLASTFGQPGLGSGGENATGFELIPFMGFLRIAGVDLRVFLAYLLIFGPGVILPTIWAFQHFARELIAGTADWIDWSALMAGLTIVVLPFSTFREPLGLLRLAAGLVLALLVLWAREGRRRLLRYGWLSLAYLALLVQA